MKRGRQAASAGPPKAARAPISVLPPKGNQEDKGADIVTSSTPSERDAGDTEIGMALLTHSWLGYGEPVMSQRSKLH